MTREAIREVFALRGGAEVADEPDAEPADRRDVGGRQVAESARSERARPHATVRPSLVM